MQWIWPTGFLTVGWLALLDVYGIELGWNRKDLIGGELKEDEVAFADYKVLELVSSREVAIHGSIWRALVAKIFRPRRLR